MGRQEYVLRAGCKITMADGSTWIVERDALLRLIETDSDHPTDNPTFDELLDEALSRPGTFPGIDAATTPPQWTRTAPHDGGYYWVTVGDFDDYSVAYWDPDLADPWPNYIEVDGIGTTLSDIQTQHPDFHWWPVRLVLPPERRPDN